MRALSPDSEIGSEEGERQHFDRTWSLLGGVAADEASPESLRLAVEELQLRSEIRALEMEVALMDLRRELEQQEGLLEAWREYVGSEKKVEPEDEARLKKAEEQVQELRAKCSALEAGRPPRVPSPRGPATEAVPAPLPPTSSSSQRPQELQKAPEELARRSTVREAKKNPSSRPLDRKPENLAAAYPASVAGPVPGPVASAAAAAARAAGRNSARHRQTSGSRKSAAH